MEWSEIGFSIVLGLILTGVVILFGESIASTAQWFSPKHSIIARHGTLPPPSTQINPQYFQNAQNLWIYTTCWRAIRGVKCKGTVIVVHGMNEHLGCFAGLAKHLNSVGFDVHALDLQGHGQSEGDRVYVQDYKDYVADLIQFVKQVKKGYKPGSPMFIYAHSLGGMISILALEKECDLVDGAVFSAPALMPKITRTSYVFLKITKCLETFLPKLVIPTGVGVKWCSRNWVSTEWKKRDPLRLKTNGIKLHTVLECLRGAENAEAELSKLVVPFLMLAGSDDVFVECKDMKQLLEKKAGSKDKTFKVISGAYHELHKELEIVAVQTFKQVARWYLDHLPKAVKLSG